MFGRKATTVAITKYLDTYQQNERLDPKVYKALSATFLKTVKKQEAEVAKKLQEGNENDHSRHEDYILSHIGDPLRTQVYCHINRGVENAKTIMELKKQFNEREYLQLIELISCEMKSQFVAAQSYIYDATKESYAKYQVLILLRHGEGYFTANNTTNEIEYFQCIDLLGVMDCPFINDQGINTNSISIVSRSPCLVGLLTLQQLIDCIKKLDTVTTTKDAALTFLLARSVRIAKEEERKRQEEEFARQEQMRKRLAEWKDYIKAGDIYNVSRYINGGFNVNSEIGIARDTPVILAVYSKSVDLIQYLLSVGANLSLQNEQGLTALHVACQIGWIQGVKELIRLNAAMIPDKNGNLPTHIAAQQNNKELIQLFVQFKRDNVIDVNWYAKNNMGDTVIDACIDYELKKVIVPKGTLGYNFSR